jgi:hypothetical protein
MRIIYRLTKCLLYISMCVSIIVLSMFKELCFKNVLFETYVRNTLLIRVLQKIPFGIMTNVTHNH